jgi:hypothetical protein
MTQKGPFRDNQLGPQGGTAVAAALVHLTCLTKLEIAYAPWTNSLRRIANLDSECVAQCLPLGLFLDCPGRTG